MKVYSYLFGIFPYSILSALAAIPLNADAANTTSHIIRHLSIYEKRDEYCAWPAIARTATGDIVVIYTRSEEHLGPDGEILLSRSTDNGNSWEPPVVIYDTLADDRESGVTALSDGRLFTHFRTVQWKESNYRDLPLKAYEKEVLIKWINHVNQPQYLNASHLHRSWSSLSADGGKTWSKPMPGKDSIHGGLQLQNGSLLVASYREDGGNIGVYAADNALGQWEQISTVVCPRPKTIRFGEPHILQLPAGRIIMMIRATAIPYDDLSPLCYLWGSYSDDDGKTWAEPYETPLWGYPPHLRLLSDGRVLVTYGHRRPPFGQRACISEDGVNWKKENEIILRGCLKSGNGRWCTA